jgi:hypothetical protein
LLTAREPDPRRTVNRVAHRTQRGELVTDVRYGKQDQHRSHKQWLRLRNGLDLPTQHGLDDADGGRHQTVPGAVVPVAQSSREETIAFIAATTATSAPP